MANQEMDHLESKRRTVEDLIQFVKTRTDRVSNYTLLLGPERQ
jgi:hypothetical protein